MLLVFANENANQYIAGIQKLLQFFMVFKVLYKNFDICMVCKQKKPYKIVYQPFSVAVSVFVTKSSLIGSIVLWLHIFSHLTSTAIFIHMGKIYIGKYPTVTIFAWGKDGS